MVVELSEDQIKRLTEHFQVNQGVFLDHFDEIINEFVYECLIEDSEQITTEETKRLMDLGAKVIGELFINFFKALDEKRMEMQTGGNHE